MYPHELIRIIRLTSQDDGSCFPNLLAPVVTCIVALTEVIPVRWGIIDPVIHVRDELPEFICRLRRCEFIQANDRVRQKRYATQGPFLLHARKAFDAENVRHPGRPPGFGDTR
jgi:hypothetical protein